MQDVSKSDLAALILAGGKGTRMKSERPKVLHELLGEPMLWFVWQAVLPLLTSADKLVLLSGYKAEQVQSISADWDVRHVVQKDQLGTGHALLTAWPELQKTAARYCLVLNGDAPLITSHSLMNFVQKATADQADLAFMSIELEKPSGYGRVKKDKQGYLQGVFEEADLDSAEDLALREVNAGVYFLNMHSMQDCLLKMDNHNQQGEYYITQLVDLGLRSGMNVLAYNDGCNPEFLGVNSPQELIDCEGQLQERITNGLLQSGVLIRNKDQVRISPRTQVEPGAEITGPAEIYGCSWLGAEARISAHVFVRDSHLGKKSCIESFCHLDQARVEHDCQIGPYARLRPGSVMRHRSKVGNFVEVKKSDLQAGCKVNHLSYIGDAWVGEQTNVGAGTITCNYDGRQKHQTIIGDNVFIGSNTSLVAPVRLEDNSLIGAGSTITKDVPQQALAVARCKQKNLMRKIKKQGQD